MFSYDIEHLFCFQLSKIMIYQVTYILFLIGHLCLFSFSIFNSSIFFPSYFQLVNLFFLLQTKKKISLLLQNIRYSMLPVIIQYLSKYLIGVVLNVINGTGAFTFLTNVVAIILIVHY